MEDHKKTPQKSIGKFWFWNQVIDSGYLRYLKNNIFNVLIVITRHYNKSGSSFPSLRRIAELTGLHHSIVKKKILALEKLNIIKVDITKNGCKARYNFTQSAIEDFVDPNKLLIKPDTKDVVKEVIKDNGNNKKNIPVGYFDNIPVYRSFGKLRIQGVDQVWRDFNGTLKDLKPL